MSLIYTKYFAIGIQWAVGSFPAGNLTENILLVEFDIEVWKWSVKFDLQLQLEPGWAWRGAYDEI
jgi:hypothetical protein